MTPPPFSQARKDTCGGQGQTPEEEKGPQHLMLRGALHVEHAPAFQNRGKNEWQE